MILWRVSDGKRRTEYIRAENLDKAKEVFDQNNLNPAIEFQPTDEKVHAVYFSDAPSDPAYFKGTKAEAMKGARQYIRQWGLDATIERVETL